MTEVFFNTDLAGDASAEGGMLLLVDGSRAAADADSASGESSIEGSAS